MDVAEDGDVAGNAWKLQFAELAKPMLQMLLMLLLMLLMLPMMMMFCFCSACSLNGGAMAPSSS